MTVNPTPDHLEIKQDGEPRKLFMSYGLLNRLTVIIGGSDRVPLLAGDPAMQEEVLLEVFTKREKNMPTVRPDDLEELDVSLADIGNILDWVGGHVTNFFLQATERSVVQAQKTAKRMESLQATVTGISGSPSLKPAA